MEVLNKEKVLEHAKKLINEGKVDRAIIEYKKLLDVDPKDMRIKLRVAELLARQKKVGDAVKVYNEVADSYTEDGFFLKAVTVYKNILRLNPSLVGINYKLAELYEKMGLAKDAIHQYQIIANSYEQHSRYDDLIEIRNKIVALDRENIPNRIRLAETYQYKGDEEAALDEYEKIINDIKLIAKSDQLIELYEKVLSYRPDNVEMTRSICNIYYKRGEWKKVLTHLEGKAELIAKEIDLLLIQAEIYGRLNQLETSKNKYKEVADLYVESGELDRAFDAYKEMLVVKPDSRDEVKEWVSEIDPDVFGKIDEEAAEKRKRLEERAAASEEAPPQEITGTFNIARHVPLTDEEVKKKLQDADGSFELGKAYHQMGLKDEARPELTKAIDMYKELYGGGYKDGLVIDRLKTLEEWLGIPPKAETKAPSPLVPPKAEKVAKPGSEDTASLHEKATDEQKKAKIEKETVKTDEKPKNIGKKRDKRMGFV